MLTIAFYRSRTSSQQPMLWRRSKGAAYVSNTFKGLSKLMRDLCGSSMVKTMSTVSIISRCMDEGICTYIVASVGRRIEPGRWPLHTFPFPFVEFEREATINHMPLTSCCRCPSSKMSLGAACAIIINSHVTVRRNGSPVQSKSEINNGLVLNLGNSCSIISFVTKDKSVDN